jgi:hypothetical protein
MGKLEVSRSSRAVIVREESSFILTYKNGWRPAPREGGRTSPGGIYNGLNNFEGLLSDR